ncbi:DivIVA domain-containing protein [Kribbella sp. NPDC048915]|uniref:DivIVA domain-containing protein n=1 Tax=Kribbella sp. NPDC048915 TaxID=3155148 RepID=UPI0033CFA496
MTNGKHRHGSPHYHTPDAIRSETFERRWRGLDPGQVYEYLDGVAEQVHAHARELNDSRAENQRLQIELQRTRTELQRVQAQVDEYEQAGDRVNEQIVELFSQAQLVAEQMVQDVSKDARERIGQARAHERRIVEEAMDSAGQQVRSYAQSAQAQMQSLVDTFATEIDRIGNTSVHGEAAARQKDAWFDDLSDWQVRLRSASGGSASPSAD